jgi:hypothetical protein
MLQAFAVERDLVIAQEMARVDGSLLLFHIDDVGAPGAYRLPIKVVKTVLRGADAIEQPTCRYAQHLQRHREPPAPSTCLHGHDVARNALTQPSKQSAYLSVPFMNPRSPDRIARGGRRHPNPFSPMQSHFASIGQYRQLAACGMTKITKVCQDMETTNCVFETTKK